MKAALSVNIIEIKPDGTRHARSYARLELEVPAAPHKGQSVEHVTWHGRRPVEDVSFDLNDSDGGPRLEIYMGEDVVVSESAWADSVAMYRAHGWNVIGK